MLCHIWYTLWLSLSLNTATAIIAEHSYFIWKKQPSKSSEPLKKSFHIFQSSPVFKNISNAILELDERNANVPAAIVKIALDNRLCKSSIFFKKIVIPLSLSPLQHSRFSNKWFLWMMYVSLHHSICGLIFIFIIGFKLFTWSEEIQLPPISHLSFHWPYLVRSPVKILFVFLTPIMLYHDVNKGLNTSTLVGCKMEHNEQVGHELQVLYQSLHQPVLSDNQVAFI